MVPWTNNLPCVSSKAFQTCVVVSFFFPRSSHNQCLALKSRGSNLSGSMDNKEMQLLLSLVQGILAAFCCDGRRVTR